MGSGITVISYNGKVNRNFINHIDPWIIGKSLDG